MREHEDVHLSGLARFAAELSFSRLPESIDASARKRLADFVAIASRGARAPGPRELFASTDATGPCSVIGTDRRAGAPYAAWINSAAGHALGLDDFHAASTVHPGVVVIPAVLACAQELNCDLGSVVTAIVAGYEVAARFGSVLPKGVVHRSGFHPTTVFGLLGATAGCLCLQDSSETQLLGGLRLAACFAGGLAQFGGDPAVKALEVGNAARMAVDVVRLVAAGVTGPRASLSLEGGLFHAVGHGHAAQLERLSLGLGTRWEVLATSFKPWAQGTTSHVAVAAAIEAMRKFGRTLASVAEVRVEQPALERKSAATAGPGPDIGVISVRDAQQDPAHCIAVALIAAGTGADPYDPLVEWYEDAERLNAPAILGLRDKVEWVPTGVADGQVTVHLWTEHGDACSATSSTFPGDASADAAGLSWEHIEARGRRLVGENVAWWPRFVGAVRTAGANLPIRDLLELSFGA